MTRLDRIISAFNDYDEEVSELIMELKAHGCRRED